MGWGWTRSSLATAQTTQGLSEGGRRQSWLGSLPRITVRTAPAAVLGIAERAGLRERLRLVRNTCCSRWGGVSKWADRPGIWKFKSSLCKAVAGGNRGKRLEHCFLGALIYVGGWMKSTWGRRGRPSTHVPFLHTQGTWGHRRREGGVRGVCKEEPLSRACLGT